jgi:hypothetical protein
MPVASIDESGLGRNMNLEIILRDYLADILRDRRLAIFS